jgi:hypothetical protein
MEGWLLAFEVPVSEKHRFFAETETVLFADF